MNKKIIIVVAILVVVIAVIAGVCIFTSTTSNIELDLQKADENIANIKQDTYITSVATGSLSESLEIMGDYAIYVYDFDLETYGIDTDKILYTEDKIEFTMYETEDTSFMMFKAADGQEDALLAQVNEYYKDKDVLIDEVEGYTVYLDTLNNESALDMLKNNGYVTIFSGLMPLDDDTLSFIGLSSEDLEVYSINLPSLMISSECYLIIKPVEGKEEAVKTALDAYFATEEEKWSTYLPTQYDLIKNKMVTNIGDYLVYIVSSDNDRVLVAINEAKI